MQIIENAPWNRNKLSRPDVIACTPKEGRLVVENCIFDLRTIGDDKLPKYFLTAESSTRIRLRHCVIIGAANSILCNNHTAWRIEECAILSSRTSAITVDSLSSLTLVNCWIHNFGYDIKTTERAYGIYADNGGVIEAANVVITQPKNNPALNWKDKMLDIANQVEHVYNRSGFMGLITTPHLLATGRRRALMASPKGRVHGPCVYTNKNWLIAENSMGCYNARAHMRAIVEILSERCPDVTPYLNMSLYEHFLNEVAD